jgi:heme a synthase
VWCALFAAIALAWRMRGQRCCPVLDDALSLYLLAVFVQGSIGYVQYALGVPASLVEVHVLGSVLVSIAALRLLLATTLSTGADSSSADAGAESRLTALY